MQVHSAFFVVASIYAAVMLWQQFVKKAPPSLRSTQICSAAFFFAYILK